MRIVRLANFVAPHSGGLRTSLAELGAGYLAAGHEPVLVIPGERDSDQPTAQGRVITLRAPRVPFAGGYRVLWRRRRLAGLLIRLRPDVLEVSDRTTLRWTGTWAREHGVPAVMVSHESVTALLAGALLPGTLRGAALSGLGRVVADWLNRRTARAYQQVICTTGWAAAEFERIGAGNLVRVPLGVDLAIFTPRGAGSGQVRARYVAEGQILLVHCGRLLAGRMRSGERGRGRGGAAAGPVHLDATRDPATCERRYWSADRLHPNERGHRLIACRFHARLVACRIPGRPRPRPGAVQPAADQAGRRTPAGWLPRVPPG